MPVHYLDICNDILSGQKKLRIAFKLSKIIWGAVLCALFVALLLAGIFYLYYPQKLIFVFLCYISLHIFIFEKIRHLLQYKKRKRGLTITREGLFNNTVDTEVFIPWKEITDFGYAYYRANNQIFINVEDPEKYEKLPRNTYLTWFHHIGKFFRTKPGILWIDVDTLDITEDQLIHLLPWLLHEAKRYW